MTSESPDLYDVVKSHLVNHMVRSQVPNVLYHLTDMAGLLGIVESKRIRASLATELNDSSEVIHGMNLLAELLREQPSKVYAPLQEALQGRLARNQEPPWQVAPYVVSMCARSDRSGAWLNYGRLGRGVALGLRTDFAGDKSDLIEVDYDSESQRRRMFALLEAVLEFVGDANDVESVAEDLLDMMPAIAVQMKNPCFVDEQEWRKCVFLLSNERTDPTEMETVKFRASGDRLIPYQEVHLELTTDLKEVVLGHAAPTSEESVRLLLKKHGLGANVTRSTVSVR